MIWTIIKVIVIVVFVLVECFDAHIPLIIGWQSRRLSPRRDGKLGPDHDMD